MFQNEDGLLSLDSSAAISVTTLCCLIMELKSIKRLVEKHDVIHYKNHAVIKLLEKHGAKPPVSKMKKEMEKVMKTFEY
ncbi:hypothetical protein P3L10_028123 [Capsicum annuum]